LEYDGTGQRAGVLARVAVPHGAQRGLIVRGGRASAQREHSAGGVIAAGDAELIGEAEHVLGAREAGPDRDRRARGVAGGGDRQRRRDRRGGVVLGVCERARLDPGQDSRATARGQRRVLPPVATKLTQSP